MSGVNAQEKRERSLTSYLVVPRPREALLQGLLPVWGYGIVHLASPASAGVAVGAAVLAMAVFELCLYQARYMLNDLADADVDRAHIAAEARGRQPGAPEARRRMVQIVVVRLVLATAVVALLPGQARTSTLLAVVGLVAATLAYEAARMPGRRRPAVEPSVRLSPAAGAVFVIVGSGYALRFAFGVALAGATGDAVALSVLFGWVYGTMIATMAWTLEGAGLRATGGTAVLASKPHVGWLARFAGENPSGLEQPLIAGPPARLLAWLFAAVTALAVGLVTVLGDASPPVRLTALLAVCAGVGPLLLACWPSDRAGVTVTALNVVAAAGLAPGDGRAALVVLLLLVSAMAATARSFTVADMGRSFRRA